ncbi:MAG: hypothetical protein AAGD32_12515 [Planctomycetota bacterium]
MAPTIDKPQPEPAPPNLTAAPPDMSAPDPIPTPPISGQNDPRPPASVPGSELPDPPTTPASVTRVSRERPDFDYTPPMVKLGYVVAAVVIALMFIMAAMSVMG